MSLQTAKRGYSVTEVMEMYGLSRATVYKEINSGNLQSIKVASRRLIPASALNSWEAKLIKQSA